MFVLRNRKQTHNCSQKRNSYTILFMYVVKMGGNYVFLLMWVFGISFGVAGDSSSVILISVCTSFFEYVLPTWSKLCKEECKFYFSIVLTRIWNVSFPFNMNVYQMIYSAAMIYIQLADLVVRFTSAILHFVRRCHRQYLFDSLWVAVKYTPSRFVVTNRILALTVSGCVIHI